MRYPGFQVFLAFLALSSYCEAAVISNYNAQVDNSGHVSIEEKIIVPGYAKEDTVAIPSDVENVRVVDPTNSVSYEIEPSDGFNLLKLYFSSFQDRNRELTLSYESSYITGKSKDVWTLRFSIPTTPSRTIVKIGLPTNSTIIEWEPKVPFSPEVNGIYVYPETDHFNFTLNYTFSGEGMSLRPDSSFIPVAVFVLFIVSVLILIIRRSLSRKTTAADSKPQEKAVETKADEPKPAEPAQKTEEAGRRKVKDSVINMLDGENELRIVRILEEAEDEITQASIYNTTHIPKASLSDIMKRLERRNIVERRKQGRRNWIKLKEWVFS
ncbi:MAG: hypothetical protein V1921_08320 [Candidatus Altiarchaeota archaeon]